MAQRQAMGLRFDQRLFRDALRDFASRVGPDIARQGTKKISLDIVSTVVKSLNGAESGYPNPKRIDTGRYRAAWVATEGALGAGSTVGVSSGDASASAQASGLKYEISIANNVEYGPYVEHGTAKMAPGLHLHTGLREGTRKVKQIVGALMKREMEGA